MATKIMLKSKSLTTFGYFWPQSGFPNVVPLYCQKSHRFLSPAEMKEIKERTPSESARRSKISAISFISAGHRDQSAAIAALAA
jgi:hypothetical protein